MHAEIVRPLESDEFDTAVVRFVDDFDGTSLTVELTLAGDPFGLSGSPVPFVITSFRVGRAGIGRPLGWEGLTGTLVRKLPLRRYTNEASRLVLEDFRRRNESRPNRDPEALLSAAKAGPKDEVLRLVGELYGEALVGGGRPAKTISEQLGLPTSTATRWIRKARDKGYISVLKSELRDRSGS